LLDLKYNYKLKLEITLQIILIVNLIIVLISIIKLHRIYCEKYYLSRDSNLISGFFSYLKKKTIKLSIPTEKY